MDVEQGVTNDKEIIAAWANPAVSNPLFSAALAAHFERDIMLMREAAARSAQWQTRLAAVSRRPELQALLPGCGSLHISAASPEDPMLSGEMAAAAGLEFQFRTSPTRVLHFPLSGITVRRDDEQLADLSCDETGLVARWGGSVIRLADLQSPEAGVDAGGWRMSVLRSFGGVSVDNCCAALQHVVPPGSAVLTTIDARNEENLGRTFRLLAKTSPALLSEMAQTGTRLVPLRSMPGSNDPSLTRLAESFSARTMPWTVYATILDPVELVHLVAHEYHHLKLFLLEEWRGPLTLDPDVLVMAPWRPDIRKVYGLIHGIYVFWLVTKIFAAIYESFPPSGRGRRRLIMWNVCTERGLTQLARSGARMTPIGQALVEAIAEDNARRMRECERDSPDDVRSLRHAVDSHLASAGSADAPEPAYLLHG